MIRPALLALTLTALPAHAADSADTPDPGKPREELQSLRTQIDSLQKELQQNEATKAEASDALKQSERAISEANRLLDELSSAHAATQSQLQFYKNQLATKRRQTLDSQQQLARLLRSQYKQGSASNSARLLLSNGNPADAARQLKYYQYIARAQAQTLARLQREIGELNALVAEITDREQQLARIRSQKSAQKSELQQQQQNRQQVLQKLASEISAQRNQISHLRDDEKRLTNLIDHLNKLIEQRQRAEQQRQRAARIAAQKAAARQEKLARAEKARQQTETKAPRSEPRTTPAPPPPPPNETEPSGSSGFVSLRGKLRQPAGGEIVNRFGSARAEGAGNWKGVFVRTRSGEEIHVIAAGQVVFADWLRGFGNLIIVDHGSGYMSLYGHNEALLKQVGAQIKAGDVIARAGNSGGNAETGLYFEIRHRGAPLDPAQWVRF